MSFNFFLGLLAYTEYLVRFHFMSTEPEIIEGETTDYIVHIVTGTKPGAGTDANVFISIIGIRLDYVFSMRKFYTTE